MGWFDDNHPMGQAAEDAAHEAFEAFAGKWQRDPPKALSSRVPPKRLERPGAEWGERGLARNETMQTLIPVLLRRYEMEEEQL